MAHTAARAELPRATRTRKTPVPTAPSLKAFPTPTQPLRKTKRLLSPTKLCSNVHKTMKKIIKTIVYGDLIVKKDE